jgi:hypothetical protein
LRVARPQQIDAVMIDQLPQFGAVQIDPRAQAASADIDNVRLTRGHDILPCARPQPAVIPADRSKQK